MPELVVLAVAAGLGSLVAEARRGVPGLPRQRRAVLRRRPARPARCPRDAAPCAAPPLSSNSYISLRTTSVASPSRWNTPDVLEHRAHDQPVAGAVGAPGERGNERLPAGRLRREDVVGTLRRPKEGHPRRLPSPLQILGDIDDRNSMRSRGSLVVSFVAVLDPVRGLRPAAAADRRGQAPARRAQLLAVPDRQLLGRRRLAPPRRPAIRHLGRVRGRNLLAARRLRVGYLGRRSHRHPLRHRRGQPAAGGHHLRLRRRE